MLKEYKSSRNSHGLPPQHSMRVKPSMTKPLLALFIEHMDAMKKEMRQRKALTKLQNVKSTRISTAHLKSSALNRLV